MESSIICGTVKAPEQFKYVFPKAVDIYSLIMYVQQTCVVGGGVPGVSELFLHFSCWRLSWLSLIFIPTYKGKPKGNMNGLLYKWQSDL